MRCMNTALARWIVVDRLNKKVVLWPQVAWSSARLPPSMTKT